jgi:hypothetical protein
MDFLFIRTKLQAIIALKLISEGELSKKFIFIKNYWKNRDEDSESLEALYSYIESQSYKTLHFIEGSGLIRNSLLILFFSFICSITRGKFYFAGINLYNFAISIRLNPFLKFITFDDGIANILENSLYYSKEKLQTSNLNIGRNLLNLLFPFGSCYYIRQKGTRHFSIYKDNKNILINGVVNHIEISWKDYLSDQDKLQIKKLYPGKLKILIGTDFSNLENFYLSEVLENNELKFDIIIPHPRDNSELLRFPNVLELDSLAESFLDELRSTSSIREIEVYHFTSSATIPFIEDKKFKFIDLKEGFSSKAKEGSLKLDSRLLVYVDTIPHLESVKNIQIQFFNKSFQYVTNNSQIFKKLGKDSSTLVNSKKSMLRFARKLTKNEFDGILVARVDEIYFQILFKFSKIENIYTFDEGLFTVQHDSIYNSQVKIDIQNGLRAYLSSKLYNLPLPAANFLEESKLHFTHFSKANFSRSVIHDDKIVEIRSSNQRYQIKKIFIGQPWHYMGLDSKHLKILSNYINSNEFDLYLIHPREEISIIENLIHPSISFIKMHSSAEVFLQKLINVSLSEVYTIASTLVTGLGSHSIIKVVSNHTFPNEVKISQDNLCKTLDCQKTHYEFIEI